MKILESVTRVLIVISVSFSRNVTHRGVVSERYRVLSSRRYIIPKSNHHLTFRTIDEFSWFFLEYLINFSTLSLKGRGNISVIVKPKTSLNSSRLHLICLRVGVLKITLRQKFQHNSCHFSTHMDLTG